MLLLSRKNRVKPCTNAFEFSEECVKSGENGSSIVHFLKVGLHWIRLPYDDNTRQIYKICKIRPKSPEHSGWIVKILYCCLILYHTANVFCVNVLKGKGSVVYVSGVATPSVKALMLVQRVKS